MKTAAIAAASLLAVFSATAAAQAPATVTGRTTNEQGRPENEVQIRIPAYNVGALSAPDGSYRLVVPASRLAQARGPQGQFRAIPSNL